MGLGYEYHEEVPDIRIKNNSDPYDLTANIYEKES